MLYNIYSRLKDLKQHLQRVRIIWRSQYYKKINPEKYERILSEVYEKKMNKKLNWEHLETYTEKMQWEKIHNHDPEKTRLSDKYLVRDWVEDKIGKEYLIPLLGVWEDFSEIDLSSLPKRFVLKTNHGSGTNYIVKDKDKENWKKIAAMFNDWMKIDYAFAFKTSFELQYSDISRRIIAEQYIDGGEHDLRDYKFLCFDGVPYYCWVDVGRYSNHCRNVYNMNWELQPWREFYPNTTSSVEPPVNFDEMIELVKKLCAGFSQVRVDLYNVNGKIYFGEMTFTNGSGLQPIIPSQYDKVLGDLWRIER